MGKKQELLEDLYKYCQRKHNYIFDNDLVKKFCKKHNFKNPFDVTKLDNTSLFSEIMLKNDVFILHIGKGNHKFVKGINNAYYKFETIKDTGIINWKYRKSMLNEYDTSESNILSVASNQKIIHDFLYHDIVASPKVYNSRRTKASFKYKIGTETVVMDKVQMEIDLTMELNGVVTIFEGKNNFPKDFAIYQIYHPFLYFSKIKSENKLPIDQITCCYVLRKRNKDSSIIRLYNYNFKNTNDISSINLINSAEYRLTQR